MRRWPWITCNATFRLVKLQVHLKSLKCPQIQMPKSLEKNKKNSKQQWAKTHTQQWKSIWPCLKTVGFVQIQLANEFWQAKVYPYIQSRFYRSPEAYSAHLDTGEFAGKARQRVNNYFLNIFWLEFCGWLFLLGCFYPIHFQDCLLDIAFPDAQDTKLDLWVRVCAERT